MRLLLVSGFFVMAAAVGYIALKKKSENIQTVETNAKPVAVEAETIIAQESLEIEDPIVSTKEGESAETLKDEEVVNNTNKKVSSKAAILPIKTKPVATTPVTSKKDASASVVPSEVVSKPTPTTKEDQVSTKQASNDNSGGAQLTGNLANMVGGNGGKRFTGNLEMSVATDLRTFEDEEKVSSSSLFFRPRYRLNDQYTMIGTVWVDKGLSQGFEETLRDTRVGVVKRPINLGGGLLIAPNITATLPTSEMSARNQELRVGLEVNPTFIYQANSLTTLIYTPRFRRNFHRFTTSRTDQVNVEYSTMQIFAMAYSMSDKWTFQPAFIYGETWTYEGTRRDPIFMIILEVNYLIDREKYITLGTLTNGSLYEAERGPDRNIELYDENTTSVYANVGILF